MAVSPVSPALFDHDANGSSSTPCDDGLAARMGRLEARLDAELATMRECSERAFAGISELATSFETRCQSIEHTSYQQAATFEAKCSELQRKCVSQEVLEVMCRDAVQASMQHAKLIEAESLKVCRELEDMLQVLQKHTNVSSPVSSEFSSQSGLHSVPEELEPVAQCQSLVDLCKGAAKAAAQSAFSASDNKHEKSEKSKRNSAKQLPTLGQKVEGALRRLISRLDAKCAESLAPDINELMGFLSEGAPDNSVARENATASESNSFVLAADADAQQAVASIPGNLKKMCPAATGMMISSPQHKISAPGYQMTATAASCVSLDEDMHSAMGALISSHQHLSASTGSANSQQIFGFADSTVTLGSGVSTPAASTASLLGSQHVFRQVSCPTTLDSPRGQSRERVTLPIGGLAQPSMSCYANIVAANTQDHISKSGFLSPRSMTTSTKTSIRILSPRVQTRSIGTSQRAQRRSVSVKRDT